MKNLTNKQKLIIAGVVLFIILIIGIVIYRAGKKKGSINLSNPIIDAPNSSNTQGQQLSLTQIKELATQTKNDMSGGNLTHDAVIWGNVLALSDTDFVRLYNEFNAEFQKDSGQTFAGWVTAESSNSWIPFSGSWTQTQKVLQQRFSKLNLV